MHFTGRTWRPPYEDHSVIIQASSGSTYNKCKFCSLYKNECFRMSLMEEFEEEEYEEMFQERLKQKHSDKEKTA